MGLRIVYGRAWSGKTALCLKEISKHLRDSDGISADPAGKRLILIVPEQFTLEMEKRLASVVSAPAPGDRQRGLGLRNYAEVLSFRRLAMRVFDETGGAARKRLNPSGKVLLLTRILNAHSRNLKILAGAVRQKGFASVMSSAISEFKRYGVTPEILDGIIGGGETEDGQHLQMKLSEINSIYRSFNAELEGRFKDADDDLTELPRKICNSGFIAGAHIWVDEFASFTPQEYAVIEALMKKAAMLTVTLCMDKGRDTLLFSHVQAAADKLADIANANGIASSQSYFSEAYSDPVSKEILHMERNLFKFPYVRYYDEVRDMALFAASNTYTEVEFCAREINRLCRDGGYNCSDIAVVAGNLGTYEKTLSAVFAQYGIPFFIDSKKPIERNPLAELINCVFDILIGGWQYEHVFRYIKTGLANICVSDADILENHVLAHGIRGSMWFADEYWTEPEGGAGEVRRIRDEFMGPVRRLGDALKASGDAVTSCAALYGFLTGIGIPDKLQAYASSLRESGELSLANEYGQIWGIIVEILEQFAVIYRDEGLSPESFGNAISAGFAHYEAGLIPQSLDQVFVGNLERSRSRQVKALLVIGANDGSFPSPFRNEGILSDIERERMASSGVELAQDTRKKAFEDDFLIYRAFSRAADYIRISYAIADNEGRSLRPSVIVSRIKKLFPGIRETSNIISDNGEEENIGLVTLPSPTFNELICNMRRNADDAEVHPLWSCVYEWYRGRRGWNDRLDKALSAINFSYDAAAMGASVTAELYGTPFYTSVSRIESYSVCPFSFFVKYGLGAEERREFTLEPPDIGIFMHEAIDRFSRGLQSEGADWRTLDNEGCFAGVSGIIDSMIEALPGSILKSSPRYGYVSDRLKRIVARSVGVIAEHFRRGEFEPVGYEIEFGTGKPFPHISVDLHDSGEMRLTGRIDRLDALRTQDGTYIRIIDYKSGYRNLELSDIYHGIQLQLAVYLGSITGNIGGSRFPAPVLPAGMLYYHLDDPYVKASRNAGSGEIGALLMKQLRMKGLLLEDVNVLTKMDAVMDGPSLIIPAGVKKGAITAHSSVASQQQFETLQRYVRKLLAEIGGEMMQGRIPVRPYKKRDSSACRYCGFRSICQFEPALPGSGYRIIRDMPDDKVWEVMTDDGGN